MSPNMAHANQEYFMLIIAQVRRNLINAWKLFLAWSAFFMVLRHDGIVWLIACVLSHK